MQNSPNEPPPKARRTTGGIAQGDIVLALCALQETQLSADNLGPRLDSRRTTMNCALDERLFANGDKLVFCEAICTVYDRMGLGSTMMEFIELLYGQVYRFAGAALRSTTSPYGFYLKKGFKPHSLALNRSFIPPLLQNGQYKHMRVLLADSPNNGYMMMKRF